MARGRMVSTTVATDISLNSLSVEAEYLFLKTIPHLDRDGLILADAPILWGKVCPRRPQLLPKIDALVGEWITAKLVLAYQTPDGRALYFTGFRKNQNFQYNKEGKSTIPTPPGYIRLETGLVLDDTENPAEQEKSNDEDTLDLLQSDSRVALTEVKLSEEKRIAAEPQLPPLSTLPPAVKVYEDNGGAYQSGKLQDGTSKKERAREYIAEYIKDTPESLLLWGRVVSGYCAQWSNKSYTIMINDYYLKDRIPGVTVAGKNGTGKPDPPRKKKQFAADGSMIEVETL